MKWLHLEVWIFSLSAYSTEAIHLKEQVCPPYSILQSEMTESQKDEDVYVQLNLLLPDSSSDAHLYRWVIQEL